MLVLSRKVNEVIRIGEITVQVLRIERGKVRLGIIAPEEVPVYRQEVYDLIHEKDKTDGTERVSGTSG